MDFGRPILPQLREIFLSFVGGPYSAFVSNLLLIILACVLVALGICIGWITTHPNNVRRVITGLRRRSCIRRAERLVRQGLAFLLRRFDLAGAYGLSFTISLAALFLGIWFFGSVLEDILAYDDTALLDVPINNFVALHRIPWLTVFMGAAGSLGSGCALVVVTVGAAIYLRRQTYEWRTVVFLAALIGGGGILDLALDLLVVRPGPPATSMIASSAVCAIRFGQTVVSSAYGAIAYLIAGVRPSWRGKVFIWSSAALVALLIGLARIYLGTAWLTDTFSRWALALFWFSIVLVVVTVIGELTGATRAPS
jgi:hypothetical protein